MMKKLLKRLALFLAVTLVLLVAAGLFVRARILATPAWYRHLQLDAATQHQAASSMNNKLLQSYSAAREAQAAAIVASHGDPLASAPPAADPAPFTVELTEAEINAFFADWDKFKHLRPSISKYLEDPAVILSDHELILAGNSPKWNTVVSLHFTPRLDNGKLVVSPLRAMAGDLPLPRAFVDGFLGKLDDAIGRRIPEFRSSAEIGPHGWANTAAVEVAMGELILDIVHDRPAEPVLMLPELGRSGDARSLPVKIIAIEISDKTLRVTFRLMTPDEWEALHQYLRGSGSN